MSDCSDESDDCDDEEEDSAGDDAAHDGERRDDRHGLPVRRRPDQDKRHQLQKSKKTSSFFFYFLSFFSLFFEEMSPFCGATDTPVWTFPFFSSFFFVGHESFSWTCFGLLVTSALRFKARIDLFVCMLCCPCATESSDSPLVQHLLTS